MISAVVLVPFWTAFGQSAAGTLTGIVRNQKQEALAGAKVTLTWDDSPKTVTERTTDKEGGFDFVGLAPGVYKLRVSVSEPPMEQVTAVQVRSAGTVDVTIVLSPGDVPHEAPRPFERSIWWGSQFDNLAMHDLPTTRRIWSLLENQETSTVTEHIDIGGLETGTLPRFSAEGASWTANEYLLNGVDVTDPYIPGSPLVDPELGLLSGVTALTAAKPTMFGGSGVNLEMDTPRPSGELHGSIRWFYTGRWLQSDVVDARLTELGFPGPERVKQFGDMNAQIGGRLPNSHIPWPFTFSFSRQQLSKNLGGFDAPLVAHVTSGMAEFTPYARDDRRFDLLYSGQHVFDSRENADLFTAPSATLRRNDNFRHFQARWSNALGSSTEFAASFGMTQAVLSSGFQSGPLGASTIDFPLLTRTGSPQFVTPGLRARYVGNASIHTIQSGPLGSHSLDLGATLNYGHITNRWESLTGMDQITVFGQGAEVIRWNTPAQAEQHIGDVSLYAQDAWRVFNSLVLTGGLRLEDSSGRATGGTGQIHWTNLEPRAGIAIPLRLHGLTFRAGWSRYGELLQGRYLDFGDPTAVGGQVFAWQDTNGDGQAQPQEIGQLLRVFGGPYSGIDPHLMRPYTDEITAGFDWPLSRWVQGRAGIFRRDVRHRVDVIDTALPSSGYAPVPILDLGDDPTNPAGAKTITVYNQNASTLGQDYLLLTNPNGWTARTKGFEAEISKPPGGRWGASASFVAMQTSAPTDPGNSALVNDIGVVPFYGSASDPNSLINADGVTYFDRGKFGRLHAYFLAPGKIWLGLVAKYYDGLPFTRLLFIQGFNQGPFFVNATPPVTGDGLHRTQFNATGDLRVARTFRLSRGSLTASISVFNFMNSTRDTTEADLSGPTFQLRVPWSIQAPRITQLGVEWSY